MSSGLSTIARISPKVRTAPARSAPIFGLAIHTTGSGIVAAARKAGENPLEYVVAWYESAAFYPHYVLGWDGTLVQVADDSVRAQHIGFQERALYLSGEWASKLPPELVALWHARWPSFASPAHLFPGPSPNNVYVAVEMLPLEDKPELEPAFPGAQYTLEQHQGIVMLAADVAARAQLPEKWGEGSRLVGHEDINPITRSTAHPPAGWDPGALRDHPWFNMAWVRALVAGDAAPPIPGVSL